MKTKLTILALIMSVARLPAADQRPPTIPVRDPALGESRPSWWLACWMGHVVVVEGTIEFTITKADEITIEVAPDALKKHYEKQEDRDLQTATSTFYVGDLTVEKVLFAAPGIEMADGTVAAMAAGGLRTTKVLLRPIKVRDEPIFDFLNLAPGKPNKGIFIFQYASLVLHFPMVFRERVPPAQLPNVQAVFTYRKKFDHSTRAGDNKSK